MRGPLGRALSRGRALAPAPRGLEIRRQLPARLLQLVLQQELLVVALHDVGGARLPLEVHVERAAHLAPLLVLAHAAVPAAVLHLAVDAEEVELPPAERGHLEALPLRLEERAQRAEEVALPGAGPALGRRLVRRHLCRAEAGERPVQEAGTAGTTTR